MIRRLLLPLLFGFGILSGPVNAAIADGPGLPKKTFTLAQLGKPLALIKNREGHGSVTMHRGYLVVIYSKDSGLGAGAFSFLDISDPTKPTVVHTEDTPETQNIREPHGWGMSGDIACLQANEGMVFWDWSDISKPKLLSSLKLPDIQVSDYDKGMWWTCWQGGYVYGGGSGNGLYIVNAKDPANPVFVKAIPISATGGFRVGPTFAIGNLLVISSTDVSGFSTFDIGDPENPKLLGTLKGGSSYSSMINGNRILGAGSEAELGKLIVYDISDPTKIVWTGSSLSTGDKGGYVMTSDGFAFAGFSGKGFSKIDLSKSDFPTVQTGTSGEVGRDEDFCTALGNIAFVANDHLSGSSLIPHQMEMDIMGPSVNMVIPKNGALKQPLTSRIGFTFTDLVDKATLNSNTIKIRPIGGAVISGVFATQTGIVNFSPSAPLLANTTYEIVVEKGGVHDFSGNGVPIQFKSSFSTGLTLTTSIPRNLKDKPRAQPRSLFWKGKNLLGRFSEDLKNKISSLK